MANSNFTESYRDQLNAWHSDLAVSADCLFHLLDNIEGDDGDEWKSSLAIVLREKFSHLVESCPFPAVVAERKAA